MTNNPPSIAAERLARFLDDLIQAVAARSRWWFLPLWLIRPVLEQLDGMREAFALLAARASQAADIPSAAAPVQARASSPARNPKRNAAIAERPARSPRQAPARPPPKAAPGALAKGDAAPAVTGAWEPAIAAPQRAPFPTNPAAMASDSLRKFRTHPKRMSWHVHNVTVS